MSRPRRGLPRAADVVIAALSLALGSPLLLVAAIAIKLGSRGPVIYRQRRVGLGGEEFEMWKLRTMHRGADPVGVGTATAKSMVLNIVLVHIIGMMGTLVFWGANPRAPIGG